jgi:hypothetical protein
MSVHLSVHPFAHLSICVYLRPCISLAGWMIQALIWRVWDMLQEGADAEAEAAWQPPKGQTGDGRTRLNDMLGY